MTNYSHSLTIILDDAHGLDVAGKGSPDGSHREYIWSDSWVRYLGQHLENIGFTVVYSAPEINEPGLWTRVQRMNNVSGPAFVLSLHNNASGMGTDWKNARGWSVWTTRGETRSDYCAEIISNNLQIFLPDIPFRADRSDKDNDYEANFIVLLSRHPSVLIEWLFQDNIEDLELIKNPYLCNTLIQIIDLSMIQIERYLLLNKKIHENSLETSYNCSPIYGFMQPAKAA